jgi:hypothetical protein
MFPQGVESETPYVSKQWNFIQDINGGIYSNNGLSLVQFDLASIYNSTNLIAPDSMFLAIPITYVSAFVNNNGTPALVAPNNTNLAGWATTALKNGYFNLVHGADVAINGKTVQQYQPYTNAYVGFKLLSSMSQDDLKTMGYSLGMGEFIDNPQSLVFNGSAVSVGAGTFPNLTNITGGVGGNGISNNKPFSLGTSDFLDQASAGVQNANTYNNGLQSRMKKVVDTTQAGQYLFGASGTAGTSYITNVDNIKKEFKPYYTINSTNYATYYDVAIIRLGDIFDSFKQLPLMKKLDSQMRFYINTGTVVSDLSGNATGVSTGLMATSYSSNTFVGTCPLMQNCLTLYPSNGTDKTISMASGLFIGTATATSITAGLYTGLNLATGAQSHFMPSCRIYYPQVQLKPERLIPYISENRAKKVVFTDFLTNTISAISAGSSASSLIQSGVSNIRGILILPFISSSTNGTMGTASGITTFAQYLSPFDTAPMTSAPISLLNLQVSVGGVNQLANTLNYGWENFIEQVTIYEKLNALDYGVSCGLISENYWNQAYKAYYVDLSRANEADLLTPRNVNISFTNNSLQTIDCLVFTEYFKEAVLDVETGLINI